MRVCDVVLNSIWYDPRVRKQIIEYQNRGIDVSCVGLKCERFDAKKVSEIPCKVDLVEIPQELRGKLHSIFKKIKREKALQRSIIEAIVRSKPDIIHANDLNALIPAYRAAQKLKCKLIYDSHEIYVDNLSVAKNKLYAAYLKTVERRIVKRVDKMVCVSHAAADYFQKIYRIEMPMVVTNCSIAAEAVAGAQKNPRFEILNHGQFYEGRGYDVMLEATSLLKEYPEILLAIRGYGRMESALRQRAEELQASNFVFMPPVTVDKLIESAASSMVGVAMTEPICLNFELSVSNKIFEYAAAGLPVIMSDIPEHRYLNDKYHFGIVLADNTPKTFADAVIKMYTYKEFYQVCAENAKKLSDEINWENEFGKLVECEKQLIAEG